MCPVSSSPSGTRYKEVLSGLFRIQTDTQNAQKSHFAYVTDAHECPRGQRTPADNDPDAAGGLPPLDTGKRRTRFLSLAMS